MDTKNRSAPIYMGNAIPPKESVQYIKIYCTVARSVELSDCLDCTRVKIINYLTVLYRKNRHSLLKSNLGIRDIRAKKCVDKS